MRYKKKLTICLFGNTGRDDLGAEARLISTIADIRQYLGDNLGGIVILTADEKRQKRFVEGNDIKYLRLTRSVVINPKIWLNSIDAIIVTLDSIRNGSYSPMDYWLFSMFVKTARILGTRVLLYSGNVDKLNNSNRRMIRKSLKSVGMIQLGNMESLSRLKRYNVKNELFCTADNRYLYPDPGDTYKKNLLKKLHLNPAFKPIITVLPKEYFTCKIDYLQSGKQKDNTSSIVNRIKGESANARESSARYIQQISNYCDWLVNEGNANVVIMGARRKDESIVRLVYETMKNRYKARMMLSSNYNVDDFCSILSSSAFMVTGHIASYELASNYGVPAIGIGSSSRMEMLFREMGQLGNYISYVSKPFITPNTFKLNEELQSKSVTLFDPTHRENEKNEILKANGTFKNRAGQNVRLLGEWLEQHVLNGQVKLCSSSIE